MLKINSEIMPYYSGVPVETPRVTIIENLSTQNDLNITLVGPEKRDWVLDFSNLEKSDFDLIYQYVHSGIEYLVEIIIGIDTVFEKYCFLSVDSIPRPINRLYSFKLIIREI